MYLSEELRGVISNKGFRIVQDNNLPIRVRKGTQEGVFSFAGRTANPTMVIGKKPNTVWKNVGNVDPAKELGLLLDWLENYKQEA